MNLHAQLGCERVANEDDRAPGKGAQEQGGWAGRLVTPAELELLEKRLASVAERERRLVKLFSFGEVDEDLVRREISDIRRERGLLEDRLGWLRGTPALAPGAVDEQALTLACGAVDGWLENADEARRQLALEALQVAVTATREEASVSGVIPLETSEFFISQRASV